LFGPIKLLFIIDCYKNPYAGTEGQILKLVQNLDKDKFEATFVVFRESEYLRSNDFPIPVDVVNIQRLSSPLSWLKLFSYLLRKKRENYSLAHIFFNDPSMICPLLLKLLGYKIIISRRDMGYWYTWLNLLLLRINTLFVDHVIANSEAVKKITMSKEGYKSDYVAVIYNGYQESAIVDSVVKNDIDFDDSEIRIGLVANIRPIKRIADAINAINIIHDTDKKVVLYVVGDGDKSQLLELAETLGITLSVRFLGPRDDIPQLLLLFHVGILCSESEGFSNTLIEYMQSGLPVVCSNVGGNPEIVEHDVNGFLYEMGDIQILAKHILELIVDDSLRERMGLLGMEKVKENYSLNNYVDHHQRLYEELLSQ
jgi:glycosyltransferase involved in cell wall biosynthesis